MDKRVELTLTDEGKEAWLAFKAAHGVTMTSLGQAIADELARNIDRPSAFWRQVIIEARAIAAERGDRNPE